MKFRIGKTNNCVPSGEYDAVITDIKINRAYKRPTLEFCFEIADGEFRGNESRGFCNADYETFSGRTKLFQWYAIVTGDALEPGTELDTDDFKRKVLGVRIETKKSKKTGNDFSNVVEILGVKCEI